MIPNIADQAELAEEFENEISLLESLELSIRKLEVAKDEAIFALINADKNDLSSEEIARHQKMQFLSKKGLEQLNQLRFDLEPVTN